MIDTLESLEIDHQFFFSGSHRNDNHFEKVAGIVENNQGDLLDQDLAQVVTYRISQFKRVHEPMHLTTKNRYNYSRRFVASEVNPVNALSIIG